MPELPEVETIRLGLSQKIIGLKIKGIQILNQKSFSGDPKQVIGKRVKGIWRKAKVLGIEVEDDSSLRGVRRRSNFVKRDRHSGDCRIAMTLLIHLKMSGQLIYESHPTSLKLRGTRRFVGGHPTRDMQLEMPNNSTRVVFELDETSRRSLPRTAIRGSKKNSSYLYFNDQRKFGWIKLVDRKSLIVDRFLNSLEPEPLEKEFTWEKLKENLLKHKGQIIKAAILDQSVVSGVGNIYACEALFHAKLDPKVRVSNMDDEQFKEVHLGIIRALKDGVKYGGSSKTHFVNEDGKKGFFLRYAFVYGRENKSCKNCQTKIKKVKLMGRGTYFCPSCQISVQ